SGSRTFRRASPTMPRTPRGSAGPSRLTARTRSSSARSASPRLPKATSTKRSTARRARSCRSSSSSRTTATASRCRRWTRPRTRRALIENGLVSEEEIVSIEAHNQQTYEEAADRARQAPDPTPDSIFDHVVPEPWKPEKWPEGLPDGSGEPLTLVLALNQTLKEEFRRNPHTYIWGQDVAYRDKGGVFNVTKGMQQEFGPRRVFNGPIAEDFILGTSDGFSRLSEEIRVVVEGAEFADYFWPAAEQMVEMSHEYWRTHGKCVPNVTVRIASGGYIGGGLYPWQNIEGWLTTLPGIRVVYPAFGDEGAGLLRTAVRVRRVH